MLNVLNNKLKNLLRDDEGFAIAMTIIVWPLMLITVSGIFVTGETIRKKMILQNAADAAAHAGAMIQADTLSRAAVINRVMAWTYIQANKMEMDYTVVNWALLANSVMNDLKAPLAATNLEASPTCTDPAHKLERTEGSGNIWGWYAGNGLSTDYTSEQLLLNGHETLQTKIESLASLKSSLESSLSAAFANISSMNSALEDLSAKCAGRVEKAAKEVFAANTKEFASGVTFWSRQDLTKNYLVPMTDESAFLALAGAAESTAFTGTPGISWWQPDGAAADGFRRAYTDTRSGLEAWFNMGVKGWQNSGTPAGCVCYVTENATVYIQGTGVVTSDGISNAILGAARSADLEGSAIKSKSLDFLGYNTTLRALPRQLSQEFINKGAVLVGAKYPQTNPLAAVFGDLTDSWFDAHTLSGSTDIWCLSAARACAGTGTGSYSRKNLAHYAPGNTEYTAVMLPVSMAGDSAGDVVKEVYDGLAPAGWDALADWSLLNNFASSGE